MNTAKTLGAVLDYMHHAKFLRSRSLQFCPFCFYFLHILSQVTVLDCSSELICLASHRKKINQSWCCYPHYCLASFPYLLKIQLNYCFLLFSLFFFLKNKYSRTITFHVHIQKHCTHTRKHRKLMSKDFLSHQVLLGVKFSCHITLETKEPLIPISWCIQVISQCM